MRWIAVNGGKWSEWIGMTEAVDSDVSWIWIVHLQCQLIQVYLDLRAVKRVCFVFVFIEISGTQCGYNGQITANMVRWIKVWNNGYNVVEKCGPSGDSKRPNFWEVSGKNSTVIHPPKGADYYWNGPRQNKPTILLRTQTLFWTVFRVMSAAGLTTSCKQIYIFIQIQNS